MRQYELMLVLRPDFDLGTEKNQEEFVKKLVNIEDIKINEIKPMGKKTLAYPINKLREAIYLLVNFQAESASVGNIQKQTRLTNDVPRYLLTVKE